ncbi:transcriptional regulator [Streptomyces sp. 150FB]|jgi:predicted NBD/HSP70 family sugar kinase|uniref:ROK family transcriptional regulator n=1 Tax=Streptomyces sp. 150FB TaxID=1576605 RepID=UPI00058966F8|nr:ROK family protein [Streptomyces sp. 150FB]KIF77897.1 transcriptional regulator [Streptomyces sp. 150FB]
MTESASTKDILRMVSSGVASSRAELVRELGLAASTVSLRVQELVASGQLTESGEGASRGGRRPRLLRVRQHDGVALAADLGSHHGRMAAVGLDGTVMDAADHSHDLTSGPEPSVEWLVGRLTDLAGQQREAGRTVTGVGVAFPGPVDVRTGCVMTPSRMPGWHRFPLRDVLTRRLGLPVFVDNDATLMAVGEHLTTRRELDHLLVVKVGRGIGCGVISDGRPYRGANGAAGDISHVRVDAAEERACSCGNIGCLETVASGAALQRELALQGPTVDGTAELLRLVSDGDPYATTLVRTAGRHIGTVLSVVVNFFNPQAVVLGGALAAAEPLVASVRAVLYERCLPMATAGLDISTTVTGRDSGLLGAGLTVLREALPHTTAP